MNSSIFKRLPKCSCLPPKRKPPERHSKRNPQRASIASISDPNKESDHLLKTDATIDEEEEGEEAQEDNADEENRPFVVVLVVNNQNQLGNDFNMYSQPNCYCGYNEKGMPCQCENSYFGGGGVYSNFQPYAGNPGIRKCGCPIPAQQPLEEQPLAEQEPLHEQKQSAEPSLKIINSAQSLNTATKSKANTSNNQSYEEKLGKNEKSKDSGPNQQPNQQPNLASYYSYVEGMAMNENGMPIDDHSYDNNERTSRASRNLSINASYRNNNYVEPNMYCKCPPFYQYQPNFVYGPNGEIYNYGNGGYGGVGMVERRLKKRLKKKKKYKKKKQSESFQEFARFPKGPIIISERNPCPTPSKPNISGSACCTCCMPNPYCTPICNGCCCCCVNSSAYGMLCNEDTNPVWQKAKCKCPSCTLRKRGTEPAQPIMPDDSDEHEDESEENQIDKKRQVLLLLINNNKVMENVYKNFDPTTQRIYDWNTIKSTKPSEWRSRDNDDVNDNDNEKNVNVRNICDTDSKMQSDVRFTIGRPSCKPKKPPTTCSYCSCTMESDSESDYSSEECTCWCDLQKLQETFKQIVPNKDCMGVCIDMSIKPTPPAPEKATKPKEVKKDVKKKKPKITRKSVSITQVPLSGAKLFKKPKKKRKRSRIDERKKKYRRFYPYQVELGPRPAHLDFHYDVCHCPMPASTYMLDYNRCCYTGW